MAECDLLFCRSFSSSGTFYFFYIKFFLYEVLLHLFASSLWNSCYSLSGHLCLSVFWSCLLHFLSTCIFVLCSIFLHLTFYTTNSDICFTCWGFLFVCLFVCLFYALSFKVWKSQFKSSRWDTVRQGYQLMCSYNFLAEDAGLKWAYVNRNEEGIINCVSFLGLP